MRRFVRTAVLAGCFALATMLLPATALAVDTSVGSADGVSVATVTPLPVVRVEDDSPAVRVGGGMWRFSYNLLYSGDTYRVTGGADRAAAMTFEGTGVGLVSAVGPNRGIARILVDGVETATVDLYAAAHERQKVVWSVSGLDPALRHTVRVVTLGSKNPSSTATGVVVDAFDIEGKAIAQPMSGGRIDSKSSLLARIGGWQTRTASAAFGGSTLRTSGRGAVMSARFKGTSVSLFGRKDINGGLADVYLDGRKVARVGLYSETPRERRVVWAASGLSNTAHRVTIKVVGAPAVAGGGSRVDVDAFQVGGTPLQAYLPTPFKYPYSTYIVIDKSDFRLYWVKNGMLMKTYPVAVGRVGMTTPSAVWRIGAKYYTDPSSVYGPRKMRLFRRSGSGWVFTAYNLHGTNQEWVIGTRASHGCIRMYNRDVLELFPQVPMYTVVITRD